MISSEKKEVLRMLNLVTEEEEDGFQTLFPSIDIIPEEEIVGIWWETTHFEESNQVRVLPVDVSHDFDRRGQLDKSWLAEEHFTSHLAEGDDLGVLEAHRL
jgi:hypothetical protein